MATRDEMQRDRMVAENKVLNVLEGFSKGEKALLYKMLYNEGMRLYDAEREIKIAFGA